MDPCEAMMLYPHCVEDDARSAQEALRAAAEAAERSAREREETQTLADAADASYANTTVGAGTGGGKPLVGILKSGPAAKKPKPKLTAKERKERSVRASSLPKSPILVTFFPGLKMAIDKAVTSLPLEFRGQDPVGIFYRPSSQCAQLRQQNLRRHIEAVIEALMDKPPGLESDEFP